MKEALLDLPQELRDMIQWWGRLYAMDTKYELVRGDFDTRSGRGWSFAGDLFYHSWRFIPPNRRISGLLQWTLWETSDVGAHINVVTLMYDLPYRAWTRSVDR